MHEPATTLLRPTCASRAERCLRLQLSNELHLIDFEQLKIENQVNDTPNAPKPEAAPLCRLAVPGTCSAEFALRGIEIRQNGSKELCVPKAARLCGRAMAAGTVQLLGLTSALARHWLTSARVGIYRFRPRLRSLRR